MTLFCHKGSQKPSKKWLASKQKSPNEFFKYFTPCIAGSIKSIADKTQALAVFAILLKILKTTKFTLEAVYRPFMDKIVRIKIALWLPSNDTLINQKMLKCQHFHSDIHGP